MIKKTAPHCCIDFVPGIGWYRPMTVLLQLMPGPRSKQQWDIIYSNTHAVFL